MNAFTVDQPQIDFIKSFLLKELTMPFTINENRGEGVITVANCDEQKTRLTLEILDLTVVKHIPNNQETEFLFKY